MKSNLCRLALCGVSLLLAAPALAQQTPQQPPPTQTPPPQGQQPPVQPPTLPIGQDPLQRPTEPEAPTDAPAASRERQGAATEGSVVSFRVGYGATTNGAGGVEAGGGTTGQLVDGGLDARVVRRRASFSAGADVSNFHYGGDSSTNQLSVGAAVGASYQTTPRSRIFVSERVTSGYARSSTIDVLSSARLVVPTAETRANSLSGLYGYDISARTQFQVSANYDHVSFGDTGLPPDQPLPPPDEAILAGASSGGARASFQHLIDRVNTLGIVQENSITSGGLDEKTRVHAIRGTWSRPLARNYNLRIEGGVSLYVIDTLDETRYAPTGSVTISRSGRNSTFSFRTERFIEVLGNTHVSTQVNPTYAIEISRRLTLNGDLTFAHNSFPANPQFGYKALLAAGGVGLRLPASLVVSASYSHWNRWFNNGNDDSTYFGTARISYVRTWN